MPFSEFKLPKEINKLKTEYCISYITSDENGFKIALCYCAEDFYDIVFDFGYSVVDYRVSQEGRRFDHHTDKKDSKDWLLIEVQGSEYLKKIYEESCGIYAITDPDLKHYIAEDMESLIDIISNEKPKVYKINRSYTKCV